MKKVPHPSDDLLLEYLDGKLDAAKQEIIEQMLNEDTTLRQRLDDLVKTDRLLREVRVEKPSKNFTEIVMSRLEQYPFKSGLSIRNGIFLLTGILVIIGIAILLLASGVFDQTITLDPNSAGIVRQYIRESLPAIPIDGKLIVNIIVILNIAIAFVVLDRAILRPFFQRRMEAGH